MPRFWKEQYSETIARELNIRGREDDLIAGRNDAEWIYYVRVCSFTFAFYSLEMLQDYLIYFSQDIKPSSRRRCFWVSGPMEQTRYDRLPLYLWEKSKRVKVVKALTEALTYFKK